MSGFDSVSHRPPPGAPASGDSRFAVRFWGVRGSIPTPGLETVRYGGNTACVEVRAGNTRLVFDGGTGLRVLGEQWLAEMPVRAHLFFTHTHWDRIQGFPFFAPAFVEGNRFDIYGAMGANGASIKQLLSEQMLRPNFPVPLQRMRSHLTFHDIAPGSVIRLDDVVIDTIALSRPNGALGYRITWQGHSIVYATDAECAPGQPDRGLLYLTDRADLLIYDAASDDRSYYAADLQRQPAAGSGSTSGSTSGGISGGDSGGIEVAIAAQVRHLILFHHDPTHDDDFLDRVEAEMQLQFAHVQLAREGMTIEIVP